MHEFVLHGIPASPYTRAATLGLEEKGAPYRIAAMAPRDEKLPGYLKRHPFGRVPLLVHGDFELYETQAILRYVDRIVTGPALTPRDAKAEARMNQICGITDWYVMPHISIGISFDRLVAPIRVAGRRGENRGVGSSVPRLASPRLPGCWGIGPLSRESRCRSPISCWRRISYSLPARRKALQFSNRNARSGPGSSAWRHGQAFKRRCLKPSPRTRREPSR